MSVKGRDRNCHNCDRNGSDSWQCRECEPRYDRTSGNWGDPTWWVPSGFSLEVPDSAEDRQTMVGGSYWARISEINRRQEEKGRGKYGRDLEDNTSLTTRQRIEHAEEEMIDGLKYLEHLKEILEDGITANDYQRAALRTAAGMNDQAYGAWAEGALDKDELFILNGALGLAGESGEVADLVKKWLFQGHKLEKDKVIEELGDVAWYLAIAAEAFDTTLGEVLQRNVDKLAKRYPEGFDKARSIKREEK